jgi:putative membrane protein
VPPSPDRRWPRWVYRDGEEPDARFSLANERTFLAWIRTALALLAAGVAVNVVSLDLPRAAQRGLAVLLLLLGIVCAGTAWVRWARNERSVRQHRPLPSPSGAFVLTLGVAAGGLVLLLVSLR